MTEKRRSCSFVLSPKKSNNFAATPLTRRQSLSAQITPSSNILIDGSENNDEAEKRERLLNRLQFQRGNQNIASPTGTPLDRRKSLSTVAGLTNQQLTDHYSKCIQLSAENKINIRNAFDLQLIDYMSEMLKRKNSDLNNFQVASCTLDASTKIYAYRVDSIHTDTIKIAGGLGRTKEKPVEGAEGDCNEDQVKKKKAKSKKLSTIETNLKNLDIVHFDLEFDVDPLFKKTASQFDEGRAGGGHFLSSLHILDDSCKLILDSETIISGLMEDLESNSSDVVSIPPFVDLTNKVISPSFSTFQFGNCDGFSDLSKLHKHSENGDAIDDEHAFDMNAIPDPFDDDYDEPGGFDAMSCDEEAEVGDEDTKVTIGREACMQRPLPPPPEFEIMHLKDHLANVPLEYSYFDTKVISAWAGPEHWKLKQFNRGKPNVSKSENKKKILKLEYTFNSKLDQHFSIMKKATKLTKNTVKNWNCSQTTLPPDLHYDPKKFCKLYLRHGVIIKKLSGEKTVELGDNIDEYNYYNKNDQENYCSNVENDGNYDDPCPDDDDMDGFSQIGATGQADEFVNAFFGDNLVEAPNKVATLSIAYARTAKKIDMKKLKSTVWTMLNNNNTNKENERTNECESNSLKRLREETKTFADLYHDLPLRLPSKMAENLSVPLAFIALLHLANEHNLHLRSLDELGDFVITHE